MRNRTSAFASVATSVILIAGLSACGNSNAAACEKISNSFKNVLKSLPTVISDPAAASKLYTNAGTEIRTAANSADGDVKTIGTKAANAMTELGKAMADPTAADSTELESSLGGLTNIDSDLDKACN